MILVGSQRGGARQLAAHLLNDRDNDHVTLHELRGFMADDLQGAMDETRGIAKGTHCTQFLFSLSLNPPKDGNASLDDLKAAADRAEEVLGLKGQPRAMVVHEKQGRRHIHVVWSRIDATQMKAVNMPFFKYRLRDLSKELFLDHGWELPDGHKTNGWKNPLNFTLAEWQQAKRLDLDPREIKQVFQSAWQRSDNLASFKNALEEHGYYVAKGDRRALVATDLHGEVFSVARWTGVKTKDVKAKLGTGENLPSIADVQSNLQKSASQKLRQHIADDRTQKREELKAVHEPLRAMVTQQRKERRDLHQKQSQRERLETTERAQRFRRGLSAVLDVLTGRLFKLRKQNETEAYAGYRRDRAQRESLYEQQAKDRAPHQDRIDRLQARHRQERTILARNLSLVLRLGRDHARQPQKTKPYDMQPGL